MTSIDRGRDRFRAPAEYAVRATAFPPHFRPLRNSLTEEPANIRITTKSTLASDSAEQFRLSEAINRHQPTAPPSST